jgi:hypothetical protein
MPFKIIKPFRYNGPLPPLKMAEVRRSSRAATATAVVKSKPISVEEVRGVTVTTWPPSSGKGIVISEGIYTTDRYAERIAAHGGVWVASESAWHLPAEADVRFILSPAAKPRPSWVCCEKAKILSHKSQHFSCQEHTMYWEECPGPDGQMIKILYSASTCGGSPYTGT